MASRFVMVTDEQFFVLHEVSNFEESRKVCLIEQCVEVILY